MWSNTSICRDYLVVYVRPAGAGVGNAAAAVDVGQALDVRGGLDDLALRLAAKGGSYISYSVCCFSLYLTCCI